MRKHKILAISDYGTSGINESIRLPLHHFHEQGHEIWHLCLGYQGISAAVDEKFYPWKDRMIPIMPRHPELKFGQTDIRRALEISKADIVLTSFDVWMVNYLAQPGSANGLDEETRQILSHQSRQFTHIAYFPIDGAVLNKYFPAGMEEAIAGFDVPVTYSRYSQNLIRHNMNIEVPFIPIAHDPSVYFPRDRKQCRKAMSLPPDSFVVGMVATNQYRKNWGEFFEAVVPFARKHKDVVIIPWTTWDSKIMGGSEIRDYVHRSGVAERVVDPGKLVGILDDEGMSTLYNAMDINILTTIGEGCGLPPLRARACGVPALVSDNTSNSEFCGHEMEKIRLRGKFFDPFGSNFERYLTDTQELTDRLEYLYNNRDMLNTLGVSGLQEMKKYEKDVVMPMWDNIIEGID